jgi:nucleotide-binding universal stress UspA family protein
MTAYQACPVARLERLLLSTDGSEFSEGAIKAAINLAKTCGSKLYVISVAEEPELREILDAYPIAVVQKLEMITRQHLESVRERAGNEGVVCETIESRGPETYKYIVDEAEKRQVEMIVMGRHGRTQLMRLMMGSVTARTIGHAPCKVLVVPRAARVTFEKILIATDGSIFSELASREAISIAKRTGSGLIALSVAKKDENIPVAKASVDKVRELAESEGIKVEALALKGVPYEVIVNTAEQRNVGFIVVGSHGRTGMEKLLMGSVTERVTGHVGCAVLVIPRP